MVAPDRDGGRGRGLRALEPADLRHPVVQPFAGAAALGLARFERAAMIRAAGCQTVARFTTGEAALVECSVGDGRALVFASDLDNRWNDFPLHATFVPFVREAVRYLAGSRPASPEYVVGQAPPGVPQTPGVTSLPSEKGAGRLVAVNVDPKESDPGRLSVDEFQTAVTRLKDGSQSVVRLEARQQEDRQHIWQYVLIMMAVVLVMESLVARRAA